ncbi:MAG: c-type cytochrome [Pelistega sp.]|nr:c-type cytochrome [Pelistega sp.]
MGRRQFIRTPLVLKSLLIGSIGLMGSVMAAQLETAAIERGKAASATCVACHQADGSGMAVPGAEAWPRIAGLDRDYMYSQLQAIKQGTRVSVSMAPFVAMLNDEQMLDVVTYYASLPAPSVPVPDADPELLKHGEKLATKGDWDRYIIACAICHGVGNRGNGTIFPMLAGQHAAYIAQQINAWKKGTRHNDPQNLMKAIAERLNERDIEAVSAWLARQPATVSDK